MVFDFAIRDDDMRFSLFIFLILCGRRVYGVRGAHVDVFTAICGTFFVSRHFLRALIYYFHCGMQIRTLCMRFKYCRSSAFLEHSLPLSYNKARVQQALF
jgi:hypothetical protein